MGSIDHLCTSIAAMTRLNVSFVSSRLNAFHIIYPLETILILSDISTLCFSAPLYTQPSRQLSFIHVFIFLVFCSCDLHTCFSLPVTLFLLFSLFSHSRVGAVDDGDGVETEGVDRMNKGLRFLALSGGDGFERWRRMVIGAGMGEGVCLVMMMLRSMELMN